MPIYEYRCQACEAEFELLVRSSTVPACPQCASAELERTISRIAPHGKIPGIRKSWRAKAAREGEMSHYSAAERAKALK